MLKAILDSHPSSAARLNPDVPTELERIIDKALEKDRASALPACGRDARRPATAEAGFGAETRATRQEPAEMIPAKVQ